MFLCSVCEGQDWSYVCTCNQRYCERCHSKFPCRSTVPNTLHCLFLLRNINSVEWQVGDFQSVPGQSREERASVLRKELEHFKRVNEVLMKFVEKVSMDMSEVLDRSVDCLERGESPVWDFSMVEHVQEAMTETLNSYVPALEASLGTIKKALEQPLLTPCFYAIQNNQLTSFDCSRRTWTKPIPVLSPVITRGAWDLVLSTAEPQIFHTGGEGPVDTVQIIHGSTGLVEVKNTMKAARKEHCALEVEGWVYVFGGKDSTGKLDLAERYNLQREEWEELPSMLKKRFKFNPVHYQGCIWLPGGCDKTIECLHLQSLEYRLFSLQLPRDSPCLTLVLPGSFLTLTSQSAHYWSPSAATSERVDSGIFNLSFYTAPTFYEGNVFLLDYQTVKVMSADTLDPAQEYPLIR